MIFPQCLFQITFDFSPHSSSSPAFSVVNSFFHHFLSQGHFLLSQPSYFFLFFYHSLHFLVSFLLFGFFIFPKIFKHSLLLSTSNSSCPKPPTHTSTKNPNLSPTFYIPPDKAFILGTSYLTTTQRYKVTQRSSRSFS